MSGETCPSGSASRWVIDHRGRDVTPPYERYVPSQRFIPKVVETLDSPHVAAGKRKQRNETEAATRRGSKMRDAPVSPKRQITNWFGRAASSSSSSSPPSM